MALKLSAVRDSMTRPWWVQVPDGAGGAGGQEDRRAVASRTSRPSSTGSTGRCGTTGPAPTGCALPPVYVGRPGRAAGERRRPRCARRPVGRGLQRDVVAGVRHEVAAAGRLDHRRVVHAGRAGDSGVRVRRGSGRTVGGVVVGRAAEPTSCHCWLVPPLSVYCETRAPSAVDALPDVQGLAAVAVDQLDVAVGRSRRAGTAGWCRCGRPTGRRSAPSAVDESCTSSTLPLCRDRSR